MRDGGKIIAPSVEQKINVTISGEDKLQAFARTLNRMANGTNLQDYWKSQKVLIDDVTQAIERYQASATNGNAEELTKLVNALRAVSSEDISKLFKNYGDMSPIIEQAKQAAYHVSQIFSVDAFKEAFSSFDILKAQGLEMEEVFKRFSTSADIRQLQSQVEALIQQLQSCNVELAYAKREAAEAKQELENFTSSNGIQQLRAQIVKCENELDSLRSKMVMQFNTFLDASGLGNWNADPYSYLNKTIDDLFERIRNGSMTAQEAISRVKGEFSNLIDTGSSNLFNTEQFQTLINQFETLANEIANVSTKLDSLTSNAILTSATQGLARSEQLTAQQRDAMASLAGEAGNIQSAITILSELLNAGTAAEGEVRNVYSSLTETLSVLRDIGNINVDNLGALSTTLYSIGRLDGLSINKGPLTTLADALRSLTGITNVANLSVLSSVDLRKFNELHVSKASLNNLETYLPGIASVDANKLRALSQVDLSNFNNLKVSKASVDNIARLAEAIKNLKDAEETYNAGRRIKDNSDQSRLSTLEQAWNLLTKLETAEKNWTAARDGNSSSSYKSLVADIERMHNMLDKFSGNQGAFVNLDKNEYKDVLSTLSEIKARHAEITNEIKANDEATTSASVKYIQSLQDQATQIDQLVAKMGSAEAVTKAEGERIQSITELARQWNQEMQNATASGTLSAEEFARLSECGQNIAKMASDSSNLDLQLKSVRSEISQISRELNTFGTGESINAVKDVEDLHERLNNLMLTLSRAKTVGFDRASVVEELASIRQDVDALSQIRSQQEERANADARSNAELEKALAKLSQQKAAVDEVVAAMQRVRAATNEEEERIKAISDLHQEWSTNVDKVTNGENATLSVVQNLAAEGTTISEIAKSSANLNVQLREATSQLNAAGRALANFGTGGSDAEREAVQALTNDITNLRIQLIRAKEETRFDDGIVQSINSVVDRVRVLTNSTSEAESQMQVLNTVAKSMEASFKSALSGTKMIQNADDLEKIKANYQALVQEIANVNSSDVNSIQILQQKCSELQRTITLKQQEQAEAKKSAQADEAANQKLREGMEEYNKQLQRLTSIRATLTKMESWTAAEHGKSADAYASIKGYISTCEELIAKLKSGTASSQEFKNSVRAFGVQVKTSEGEIRQAGEATRSWGDRIANLAGKFSTWFSITRVIMYIVRTIRQMITNTRELDTSMTQLKIVTGATDTEMEAFLTRSTALAKELGQSVTDVMKSIETFSRLGYNLDDSSVLAKYSNILANVASVDASAATTGMTSIIKGFNMDVSNTEHVADVLVEVGQKYAVSASEMMEAYEKSSAALNATNTSFEKSAGLIAAANAAVQNASTVGTALKTVSARIRQSETELAELGESTDDLAEGFSKYAEEIQSLTGFNIMVDGTTDTFKDIYDIFEGISQVWDKLSDTQQSRIAEILGGTRQLQVISSILANWKDAAGAYSDAMDSAGTATKANEIHMQSIEGRIGQLKASFQELSNNLLGGEFIKGFVEFANTLVGIMNTVAQLIDKIGGLKTVLTAITGIIISIKIEYFIGLLTKFGSGIFNLLTSLSSVLATVLKFPLALVNALVPGISFSSALKNVGISAFSAKTALSALVMVIAVVIIYFERLKAIEEERRRAASDAAAAYSEEQEKIEEYKENIRELRAELDSGNLSEQEAYDKRAQLLTIQDEVITKLGSESTSFNVLKGSIDEVNDALDSYSEKQARMVLTENREAFDDAISKMETKGNFGTESSNILVNTDVFNSQSLPIWEQVRSIFKDVFGNSVSFDFIEGELSQGTRSPGKIVYKLDVDPTTAVQGLEEVNNKLYELEQRLKEQGIDLTEILGLGAFGSSWENSIAVAKNSAQSIIDDFGENYKEAIRLTIASDESLRALSAQANQITTAFSEAQKNNDEKAMQQAYDDMQAFSVKVSDEVDEEAVKAYFDNLIAAFNEKSQNEILRIKLKTDLELDGSGFGDQIKKNIDAFRNDDNTINVSDILRVGQDVDSYGSDYENFNAQESAYIRLQACAQQYGLSVKDLCAILIQYGYIVDNLTEKVEDTESGMKSLRPTIDSLTSSATTLRTAIQKLSEVNDSQSEASFEKWLTDDSNKNLQSLVKDFPSLAESLSQWSEGLLTTTELMNQFNAELENMQAVEDMTKLKDLDTNVQTLSTALKEFQDNGYVTIKSMTDLQSTFGKLSSFKNFQSVMTNSNSTMQEMQDAANRLASDFIMQSDVLDTVTQETAGYTEATLSAMGVENAHELVMQRLAVRELEATLASKGMTDATWDEVKALLSESGASETAIAALQELRQAQYNAHLANIDFASSSSSVTSALIQEANAAGVAIQQIQALQKIQQLQDNFAAKKLSFREIENMDSIIAGYVEEAKAEIDLGSQIVTPNISVPIGGGSGGGSGGSGGSKNSSEDYTAQVEKFRKAKKELEDAKAEVEAINTNINNAKSYEEKIALQDKLIAGYKREQVALHALNEERDAEIQKTVDQLKQLEFAVDYNATTNDLWIENYERINELPTEKRKEVEQWIKDITDWNSANAENSKTYETLSKDIETANIAKYEAQVSKLKDEVSFYEKKYTEAVTNRDLTSVEVYSTNISNYYEQMKDIVHRHAEYLRSIDYSETSTEIKNLQTQWFEFDSAAKTARNNIINYLADIVKAASTAVDNIQETYSTLHKMADEYASTGMITVDTYQKLADSGVQNLSYLRNENGLLVINEERIKAVVAAKVQQHAVETALAYVESIRIAKEEGDLSNLNELIYATQQTTDATWGLVYANLSLIGLDKLQYQAAINNINALRATADSATLSIGNTSKSIKDQLTEMKNGMSSILKYVEEMIKQQKQNEIDAIEEAKTAYSEEIDKIKELANAKKNLDTYNDDKASKLKQIAKLQAQIDALSLDDSREAQSKKASLLEEMDSLQSSLAEKQRDQAIKAQEDALDQMKEDFDDEKDSEIEKIKETYSSAQKLYDLAIDYISEHWKTLYKELIDWNTEYGTVLNSEITSAWEECLKAAKQYGDYVTALGSIDADITESGSSGTNLVVGDTYYKDASDNGDASGNKNSAKNEDKIYAIIQEMYENGKNWSFSSASDQARLSQRNLALGAELSTYGVNAVRGSDGVWYVDKVGGEKLFDRYKMYTYNTGSRNEDMVHAIIREMYRNGQVWGSSSAEEQGQLSQRNIELGSKLANYGVKAVRGPDGVWYVDKVGGEKLFEKYQKYTYHTGGIAGDDGTLKDNEIMAKLEKGEPVLTRKMWDNVIEALDCLTTISKLSASLMERAGYFNQSLLFDTIQSLSPSETVSNVSNSSRPVEVRMGDITVYGGSDSASVIADRVREITYENAEQMAKILGIAY